jgi:hypothetical protein
MACRMAKGDPQRCAFEELLFAPAACFEPKAAVAYQDVLRPLDDGPVPVRIVLRQRAYHSLCHPSKWSKTASFNLLTNRLCRVSVAWLAWLSPYAYPLLYIIKSYCWREG